MPLACRGQAIGLLGGSFDPAHAGHRHVARTALARLGLAAVWWLVSPQNPLKPLSSPLPVRLASATALASGPRMHALALESRLGTVFTVDTLRALRRRYPGVRFVWLMGGDSLAGFSRWRAWRAIAHEAPICVVARPGWGVRALFGPFAQRFGAARRTDPSGLAAARPPAWSYLPARHHPHASSALRAAGAGLARPRPPP